MAWGMRNIIICIEGASIMEGRIGVEDPMDRWYNIFHRLLSRAHPETCFPIINRAVGGESTREIMARFERDIVPHNPDFCLFMAEGNNHDCRRPSRILAEGELQTLLDRFAALLPRKTKPVGVVLNPVVDAWHFTSKDPVYHDYLARFGCGLDALLNRERDIVRAFYTQHGWPYLDLYALMADSPVTYVMREDGIHLNKAGHEFLAAKMFELVNGLLKG